MIIGKCSDCGRFALRLYGWKLCRTCLLATRIKLKTYGFVMTNGRGR